ncbi:MAG: hypothetical protein WC397_00365 [Candidatus Paceibacterota bacterium]|jgi:hypothetical protein
MNHIWSILCQNSSVDEETKSLSIFNCLEQGEITIKKDDLEKRDRIIIPIAFELISLWTVDEQDKDNKLEIKIELLDPDGSLLNSSENIFDVKENFPRLRSRIKLNGLSVTKNGRYTFKVSQKDQVQKKFKTVANIPLDIKLQYT